MVAAEQRNNTLTYRLTPGKLVTHGDDPFAYLYSLRSFSCFRKIKAADLGITKTVIRLHSPIQCIISVNLGVLVFKK